MIQLHHSNRVERLVDRLIHLTASGPADPFDPEPVVVQHPGMGRWLAQQLALRTGIAANLDFPLPAVFVWRLLRCWFPDLPESQGLDRDGILWRTLALLPEHLGAPPFAEPARYLRDDPDGSRRYQLCRRIGDLFDQYLVYRPDWVAAWEQGRDSHWQARLWRAVRAGFPGEHWAGLLRRLFDELEAGRPPGAPLPARFSLFGLTALSPSYVALLRAVSSLAEVHVFLLSPSWEYWSDLVDEKGQARRRARARQSRTRDATSALLDLGNPLLASLGHAGQELLDQLLEAGSEDEDLFEDPGEATLLARLQGDILTLRDRRRIDPAERSVLPASDRSIQVHVCHSPLREVQVLRDRLLRLFDEIDGLRPRDVLVMAPDIDLYAPYVTGVLGAADSGTEIPWALADRRPRAELPVVGALDLLLDLPGSRFEASAILGLLELPAVQRRFGLDPAGTERVRTWVRESGIRWGADAAMRTGLDLPGEAANTWDFGLDRLFIGYALPPGSDLYRGVAPYPDVEGSAATDLGALAELVARLGDWRRRLGGEHTAAEWRAILSGLLDAFFDPDEGDAGGLQLVRTALEDLDRRTADAGFGGRLTLTVVRDRLTEALNAPLGARNLVTGRVTFCGLAPLRGVPFRVICLLGMNGEDFPRVDRPLDFDLIAREPRRGDRSRRRDDRYLFLEALLSARDLLYLSYVGRDIRDNSLKVPAAPVSELLDYVAQSYRLTDGGDGEAVIGWLTLEHPLQPFSRRYFDHRDPRLFSYSRGWLAAAAAAPAPNGGPDLFAPTPLPAPEEDSPGVLELDDLARFLCNPAEHFLRNRLGIRLPAESDAPADEEPFDPSGLERYGLRQRLLELATQGEEPEWVLERLRSEGLLPHGAFGRVWTEENAQRAAAFLARMREAQGEPLTPVELDLRLGERALVGQLRGLGTKGLVAARFAALRGKDRLRLWVRHLALNAAAPDGVPPTSLHLADQDSEVRLRPVPNAEARLRDLIRLYQEGLTRPLPLFAETSFQVARGGSDSAIRNAWRGNPFGGAPGEQDDPWVRIAFRGTDPLGPDFQALAIRVYGPLLAAEGDAPMTGGA